MEKPTIGMIGLGRMGSNISLQAMEKGYSVLGYDLHQNEELQKHGLQQEASLNELISKLSEPRILFVFVPSGAIVGHTLDQLSSILSEGDIIIDGGNSYWGDSIKRGNKLKEKGIYLIDCGTSGGVEGARNGACFMAGGEPKAMEHVAPILTDLAVEHGFVHTGKLGSGHFVKLVHNGIEFGMMQAIGEGMELLANYKDELNFPEILKNWNHGSVIRSWLIELMANVYENKNGFESVSSFVEDTGEVNWLVEDAMRMEVPVPVISLSVMQLFASRNSAHIADKAIAMMRHGFGGHAFGPDKAIEYERRFSKAEHINSNRLFKRDTE
ncbi:MAG TPA: decarboxylating 6-phosphogluconate dehydrogenase [Pedobacter sp.]|jgi:6-phosphogluconate dehydrogenase